VHRVTHFRLQEVLRPYYLRLYFKLNGTPAEFADAWKYPVHTLKAAELRSEVRDGTEDPAFLFLPMTNWHTRRQRTQHLAKAIAAQGHSCAVLNPYLGRQFPSLYHQDPDPRFGVLGPGLAELHIRVPREPLYHERLLRPVESEYVARALREFAAVFGAVVQIVSLPTWLDVALRLRTQFGWPIVYDCHDLLSAFDGIGERVLQKEGALFKESTLVFYSSDHLRDQHLRSKPWLTDKSVLLRNAADIGHFAVADCSRKSGGIRVAGYFGALDEWFDVDAIRTCAVKRPEVRFQLIGRISNEQVRRLGELPNVELTGEVPYERLPELLANFDAALIPFRRTPLTLATNPIKLYEYFASGIPVVSAALPEVELFGDLIYAAQTSEEFSARLDEALEENDADRRDRRKAIARDNTWESRATELVARSKKLLAKN
jgi:glycosyltransferase involved in cell wall biosynthesis